MMEYAQSDMAAYFLSNTKLPIQRLSFQYVPTKEEDKAALNFHLTQREKKDIAVSLNSAGNTESFQHVSRLLNTPVMASK
jgi:hypothetical protein